jgi:phenylacetate-CoA ligase
MARVLLVPHAPQKGGASGRSGRRVADRDGRVARSTHFENTPQETRGASRPRSGPRNFKTGKIPAGRLSCCNMLATPELMREAAQVARVEKLLSRWRDVPLYRTAPTNDFFRLPLIGKRELRENFPHNFLRPGQNLDALLAAQAVELEHTSGSSDERTAVLFGRGWWNAQEARVLRLNPFVAQVLDAHPQARRATLVPPVCNGLVCFSNFTSKTSRTMGQTLFVNQTRIPFLLTEAELARMAAEIAGWSPQFLDLDPVHGARFALYCERNGITFPSVKFILCSYEFVSVVHRRILQRVFGVPVFNLYGSTETGHLLMENERGEMKACLENVFYEIVEPDARGVGSLVVTTLTNEVMPLVRYRIGDLAERCEQPYATEYLVHGRARDTLLRRDGQRVTTLEVDRCFAEVEGVLHYQLRQNENGACHLQFIPDREPPTAETLRAATARLRDLLQLETPVTTEEVNLLPPLTSGKFRLTGRAGN